MHVALGIPVDGDASDDYLMDKGVFVLSYNPRWNVANWVAWRLVKADLGHAPRTARFHADDALPPAFHPVADQDYIGSGFDRGHLCPSADRTASPRMNATTFMLTNVYPQRHELNSGPWEDLEVRARELARGGKDLYIVAGGLFDRNPPRIGRNAARGPAVPAANFKVIVVLEHGQTVNDVTTSTPVLAFIMPNASDASRHVFDDYAVSIDEVEEASGYDMLTRVPTAVQGVLEAKGRRAGGGP